MWSTLTAPHLKGLRGANPREMWEFVPPRNQMRGVLPVLRLAADGKQQRRTGAAVAQTHNLCPGSLATCVRMSHRVSMVIRLGHAGYDPGGTQQGTLAGNPPIGAYEVWTSVVRKSSIN